MIYRCNRCDGQVNDLSGCVAHNVNDHKVTTLSYDDYALLGGSKDSQRLGGPGSRATPPQSKDQLSLLDTPEH